MAVVSLSHVLSGTELYYKIVILKETLFLPYVGGVIWVLDQEDLPIDAVLATVQ